MFGEQSTRTLLGPADPARRATIAPPRFPARDLISRAEATGPPVVGRRHARPSRRWVLTAGAVAVAAGTTAVVYTREASTVDGRGTGGGSGTALGGTVLAPVGYQYETDAQPAAARLRQLAERLVAAPYEQHTGRYTYHRYVIWGDPTLASGPYVLGYVHEDETWHLSDGSGQQRTRQLEPQYPDQASRDFWQHNLNSGQVKDRNGAPINATQPPTTLPLPADDRSLPADPAQLAQFLKTQYGAGAACKEVEMAYLRYAIPRETRAQILRVLADVPGFLWRGEATDRAGRKGLAITFDDREHDEQELLIFDPDTGALLAGELIVLSRKRTSTYIVILETDLTDHLG